MYFLLDGRETSEYNDRNHHASFPFEELVPSNGVKKTVRPPPSPTRADNVKQQLVEVTKYEAICFIHLDNN